MSKLTADAVKVLMMNSLFHDGEIKPGETPKEFTPAEGIINNAGFHPERLENNRAAVKELLDELPAEFWNPEGASFLAMAYDKHGNHWGEHRDMEALMLMGLGLELIKRLSPRITWMLNPGCMPKVVVKPI